MIKLKPALKTYVWGGSQLKKMFGRDYGERRISESWEVSAHPDGTCLTEGGTPFSDYLREHPYAVDPSGSPLPILIKYIDATKQLSVQVHPDDAYAHLHEQDNGKTELWYILSAQEGAGIYCGFREAISKEEFMTRLADGTVEECLNFIPVKRGDCYLIKAGTVHAICAGCVLCEVQQNSNVTYRVFDYNRPDENGELRPLHIDKALDVIDFSAFRNESHTGEPVPAKGGTLRLLTDCGYFRCRELALDGAYGEENPDSFVAVNVIEGEGTIDGMPFSRGDSFFVPCGENFALTGRATLILTDKGEGQ